MDASSIGVRVKPGHTAFTRIPKGPFSIAALRVSPMTANFVAPYGATLVTPWTPVLDAVFTTIPPPCARITFNSSRRQRKVPVRFTASTVFQESSVCSARGALAPSMPALFTAMSRRPNRSTTERTRRTTSASLVTSHGSNTAGAPKARSSSASASPAAVLTSETTTVAPAAASARTVAVPIPPEPPVTSATRPERSASADFVIACNTQNRGIAR